MPPELQFVKNCFCCIRATIAAYVCPSVEPNKTHLTQSQQTIVCLVRYVEVEIKCILNRTNKHTRAIIRELNVYAEHSSLQILSFLIPKLPIG